MGVLLLCVSLAVVATASRVNYLGQQVIQCPFSNEQASVLRQLEESLDVWAVHPTLIDIRVETQEQKRLAQSLLPNCSVVIEDLEREVQGYEAQLLTASADDWFLNYHTYDEISKWYQDLARDYPNQVRYVQSIGTSYQGRVMPAVHITGNISQATPRSGYAYFQCLIHAREWISGATCTYIANQLLVDYSSGNTFVRNLLDNLEIVFVPFVNPDGYVYTWTTDRMWRKNRFPVSGSTCVGIDLNRNYPEMWGNGGGSTNPCSETYQGVSAASEIETVNTMNYYRGLAAKKVVVAMIDWHSYGQLINRPWGWTPNDCPDETVIRGIGDIYVADVKAVHNRTYVNQKAYQLYETSGTSRDFFYGNGSTQWNTGFRSVAWTIELRPTAANPGFQLPPIEIIPTGQENYAGIKNFLNWFLVNGPLPQKPTDN